MRHLLFPILLALASCAGEREVGTAETLRDRHAGTKRHVSAAWIDQSDPEITLAAFAIAASAGRELVFGIRTKVARGDLNYPKVAQARHFGQKLRSRKIDRNRIGSLRNEDGLIIMTRVDFERMAGAGTPFEFELSGPRGRYLFRLPARYFADVLELAASDRGS